MEIPVRLPRQAHESEEDYARRRAAEARAFVAAVSPECLRMLDEIDMTLIDDRVALPAPVLAQEHRALARVWERHAPADR